MQVFAGYAPSQSPDVVDTSLKILSVYAMSQNDGRSEGETRLIDTAAECLRDYIMGIGKFGPPPPAMNVQQVSTSDHQTVAAYLEALARMNQGTR